MVGLEAHVELATRSKMFSRVGNPAHRDYDGVEPNTLIDPIVLALPGALPTLNKRAIDMSIMVGLALGCSIAPYSKWDRKSYFYPDLPKNYQISQYDLPLCFDGIVDVPDPAAGEGAVHRLGIIRAHLEEDAGKLLHEAPGGGAIDHSIVDFNRAGTPLLEIVTAPDFTSPEQVVTFAQMLRNICRFLGVTEGVMQKGHMRFEPNINTICRLSDGREVRTPIVEVKNLNSFKSLRGAIEHELQRQPRQFLEDGRVMGPGAKTTRGWDDVRQTTFVQREKEDAHDYRYFPDPDLPPVHITEQWRESLRAALPELPHQRERRYRDEFTLGPREATALVEERDTCLFFEACVDAIGEAGGVERERAGRMAANILLQSAFKRANERGLPPEQLGIAPAQVAGIVRMREAGAISAAGADTLFGALCESDESAEQASERLGLLQVTDSAALERWCREAIADPVNAGSVQDVRSGKAAAIGRLIGDVMKRSGGKADAQAVRQQLVRMLN